MCAKSATASNHFGRETFLLFIRNFQSKELTTRFQMFQFPWILFWSGHVACQTSRPLSMVSRFRRRPKAVQMLLPENSSLQVGQCVPWIGNRASPWADAGLSDIPSLPNQGQPNCSVFHFCIFEKSAPVRNAYCGRYVHLVLQNISHCTASSVKLMSTFD